MTLLPGCPFAVATKFHLPLDRPGRWLIGTGTDELHDCFYPRGPWRPPTADEWDRLTGAGAPADPDHSLLLFQLPDHLREGWWDLLDQAENPVVGRIPGFDPFAGRVAEFLRFKGLPPPATAQFDVTVTRPGERSTQRDPDTGRFIGMAASIAPWATWPPGDETRWPRLWGAINLGDEETAVELINLPCNCLAEELAQVSESRPPASRGELVVGFLRSFPNYPTVRLKLGSGEGYRLPVGGLILDGSTEDKQEPDVRLVIAADGQPRG